MGVLPASRLKNWLATGSSSGFREPRKPGVCGRSLGKDGGGGGWGGDSRSESRVRKWGAGCFCSSGGFRRFGGVLRMSGTGLRAERGSRAGKGDDARGGRAETDAPRKAGSLIHQPENLLLLAFSCLAPGDRARFRASRHQPFFPNLTVSFFLFSFLLPSVLSLPFPRLLGSVFSPAPQTPFSFQGLQISSFANRSWTRTDSLAWLGELQPYTWRNESNTIRFLKPWSRGTFSDQQWEQLQHTLLVYRSSFTRDIWEFVENLHVECELRDGIVDSCPGGDSGC